MNIDEARQALSAEIIKRQRLELENEKLKKQLKNKSFTAELPCKVGDNVYMTTRNNILEMQVVQIKLSKHSIVFDCVNTTYDEYEDFFYAKEIGKSVFLTRKEAEQALKEV